MVVLTTVFFVCDHLTENMLLYSLDYSLSYLIDYSNLIKIITVTQNICTKSCYCSLLALIDFNLTLVIFH